MINTVDPKFPNSIAAGVVVDETNLPTYLPDRVVPYILDRNGALIVKINGAITASVGASVVIGDAMAFASGSLIASSMVGYNGATFDLLRSAGDNADAVAIATLGRLLAVVRNTQFNNTNWERVRGNNELTLLASAARTVTTVSPDQTNFNSSGGHILINVTAITTSNLTVTVQGKDPVSGVYYDLLVGLTITATGLQVLKVCPDITASTGASARDLLPRTFRVSCAKGDASSWTYSVGAVLGG